MKTLSTYADIKLLTPLGYNFKFKVRAAEKDKCPGAFSKIYEISTEKPTCDCPKQIQTVCPSPAASKHDSGVDNISEKPAEL